MRLPIVEQPQRLFVYGTLAPGQPNQHLLAQLAGEWTPASVMGYLHEKGWGYTMGYPGVVLDEGGEEVRGYLFSSSELGPHWQRLDEFEGDEYQRVTTLVTTDSGHEVEAFIYVVREEILLMNGGLKIDN